jgi:hypothetical protein
MKNKYSFQDTGENHILYQEDMEKFDLSFSALQTYILAIKSGDLTQIKSMFHEATPKQKKGLLTLELDCSVLIDLFSWGVPKTNGVKLAQYFKHSDVENFLAQSIFSLTCNKSAFFSWSDVTIVTQDIAPPTYNL